LFISIKYDVGEIGNRPWGTWHCIAVGDKYIVKIITVKPHASLSLQLHKMRSEHWVVVSGAPRITVGDSVSDFHCGESVDIPVDTRHRLENLTEVNKNTDRLVGGSLSCHFVQGAKH